MASSISMVYWSLQKHPIKGSHGIPSIDFMLSIVIFGNRHFTKQKKPSIGQYYAENTTLSHQTDKN